MVTPCVIRKQLIQQESGPYPDGLWVPSPGQPKAEVLNLGCIMESPGSFKG